MVRSMRGCLSMGVQAAINTRSDKTKGVCQLIVSFLKVSLFMILLL
jgi:hypothetical protein